MKAEARVRFDTAKDYETIKKAARSEKRSISQFIALSALEAAKATLRVGTQKFSPSQASSQEASA